MEDIFTNNFNPEYLNSQPTRSLLERSEVGKGKFLFYAPGDPEVLNRLEEATDHLNYYEESIPRIDFELYLSDQKKNEYSQKPEFSQWKNSPGQEVHSLDSESRFQDLIKRINLSNTGVSREKIKFYKLSNAYRTRKPITTTARPIYDQIPRPILFKDTRETDSFR